MTVLLAAMPLLAVAVATLGLRRPPIQAAALGAAVAAVIVVWLRAPGAGAVAEMVAGALILGANAAAVILPGLLFVEITRRQGGGAALGRWVQALPAPTALKVVLLVIALAPFLESLTGFGVSLVAIVPAALALLPRDRALRAALLGMNVMPWGTLGLATIVGAQLADVATDSLGQATAVTSGLIFPAAALLATLVAGERAPIRLGMALGLGGLFSLFLWAANGVLGAETAGVVAGAAILATILGGLVLAGRRPAPPAAAAWPYGALFVLVLGLRLLLAIFPDLDAMRITAANAHWAPLTSPGLPLALAALLAARRGALGTAARDACSRALAPIAAVALFLLMSQAMVQGGLVSTLSGTLTDFNAGAGLALVAAFGLVSGYMTGSNLGGNALLMVPASALGDQHGAALLFAAVQNSAAGHSVLAAVPIVALLASLARAEAPEEARLLRFGLIVAVLNGALIVLAAWLGTRLGLV